MNSYFQLSIIFSNNKPLPNDPQYSLPSVFPQYFLKIKIINHTIRIVTKNKLNYFNNLKKILGFWLAIK